MAINRFALEQAKSLFAKEELPFPLIPTELADRLQKLAPWVYSTRADIPNLYDLEWFVQEIEDHTPEDYVGLGHAGYGFNTYAIHYYLVQHPIAVFLQVGWGGAYTDNSAAAKRLEGYFAEITSMFEQASQAQEAGKLKTSAIIALVLSDFYGSRWTIIEPDVRPVVWKNLTGNILFTSVQKAIQGFQES